MELKDEPEYTSSEVFDLLPIKNGEYVYLPNERNPNFILPIRTHKIFRKAVSLIQPPDSKAKLKKVLLANTPIWLLRMLFVTQQISGKNFSEVGHPEMEALVLPWNQDRFSKLVIMYFDPHSNFKLIGKMGISQQAKSLIDHESTILKYLRENSSWSSNVILPSILKYVNQSNYNLLITEYFSGSHPRKLPDIVLHSNTKEKQPPKVKLKDHPYIQAKRISDEAISINHKLYDSIGNMLKAYEESLVEITLMHGDFARTNIIERDDGKLAIIDWEDAVMDGLPIDRTYFEFREKMYRNERWRISNVYEFLVVYQFILFQISKPIGLKLLANYHLDGNEFYRE